jgi:hypothetical protein
MRGGSQYVECTNGSKVKLLASVPCQYRQSTTHPEEDQPSMGSDSSGRLVDPPAAATLGASAGTAISGEEKQLELLIVSS